MKITPENYKEAFQQALHVADPTNGWISELPEALQKGHEFVLEATEGGDWSLYHDDAEIQRVINVYFEKLAKYITGVKAPSISTQDDNKQQEEDLDPEEISSLIENTSSKHADRTGNKIFLWLKAAMPGLADFLKNIKNQERFVFDADIDRRIKVFFDKNNFKPNHYGITLNESSDTPITQRFVLEIDISNDTGHVISGDRDGKYKKTKNNLPESHTAARKKLDERFLDWIEFAVSDGLQIDLKGKPVQSRIDKILARRSGEKSTKKAKDKRSNTTPPSTYVEHITEEVKFIKRYVALHNKTKSRASILALIKSLQRSIVQKFIRKTSPLADEIRSIQDKLVEVYNKSKKDELQITINATDLSRMVAIAGGEEVYQSIKIIKRYVGLQGREVDEKTLESFSTQIQRAIKSMKVSQDDPYYDNVKAIQSSLKKLADGNKVKIGRAELNGLEGILSGCRCGNNSSHQHSRHQSGLGDISSAVLSAEQMANLQVDELEFTYPWNSLLGKPARNFSMMFHGDPGSGKTTLLLKFVEYLANTFGKVLYLSSEEHGATTLVKKLNVLMPVRPPRLDFAANLNTPDLTQYEFIVLDSVNNLKLSIDDLKRLKKDHPQTAFIIVLQHTKDGSYRGGKDWEHETEVAVKVEHGVATVYRTRYGVFGSLNFFDHFNLTEQMFK